MATLYLTEQHSVVRKDGDTLVVRIPADREKGTEKRKVRVPLMKVDQVVVLGDSTVTTPALLALLEQRVGICFCTYRGQFRGWLSPEFSRNGLLRIRQHQVRSDYAHQVKLAQAFVRGKLSNQRTLLLRSNRKLKDQKVAQAAARLAEIITQVEGVRGDGDVEVDPGVPQAGTPMGTLTGLEGAGTAAYFGVFGHLLKGDLAEHWQGRHRRPPTDPINALLSFGYVLLMNNVMSAINLVGLDPYAGYLHSSQYGKPALALDLMEEFRPIVVDSVVLSLINNRILGEKHFKEEMGAYRLTDAGRRRFLERFEARLNETIRHPVFKYKATYRRCLELQTRILAKALQEEIPAYRPFLVR
ncbi:MAG TPA: type I-D CRISPR-associated endonuclease Cas1 [Anaerolineae bacterium]|nr:type I-D CRISPR-associated endonuclease Cas1 [Anaerolineae bacterium]HIQ05836.1 type I-D CRISPR-associated endonuclease Cas1 [Anaerolineae bacterium]